MSIAIILVAPQMGENIGAAARAMKNFGLQDLRIVNPRDGWPNEKAISNAAGASDIIANAKIYDLLETAIADRTYIYATTARPRDMNKEYVLAKDLKNDLPEDARIGIMLGRESNGLSNLEIMHANKILTIETNSEYSSLNIAHSVVVICYELFKNNAQLNISQNLTLASSIEREYFFAHLFDLLQEQNFFRNSNKKEDMILKIRNIFARINNLSQNEVQTLRGIITALSQK